MVILTAQYTPRVPLPSTISKQVRIRGYSDFGFGQRALLVLFFGGGSPATKGPRLTRPKRPLFAGESFEAYASRSP